MHDQTILDRTKLNNNGINKSKIVSSTSNEYNNNTIHNSTKKENDQIKDLHSIISINEVSNLDRVITTNNFTRVKTNQD